ncbi:alpha/beta fold hydrolase [Rhizobium sp. Root708]|uniref:alpha/beta fold hydrolase n=1 Tax=Rhizobium sp. Root708 TaxID=1736592 RepID=UPI000AC37527|nr:alpha/beta fold hydrolase [Rhizobium sp. Root708]
MPHLDTESLRIAFIETGAQHGNPVLFLHGWPDDASTWEAVVSRLASNRLRMVIPTLRGFGATTFKSEDLPRTANSAVLAMDAIALMDGLGIERFSAVGHDWGSNIAEALAIGWPERVDRIALLSSMPRMGGLQLPPFSQAQRYWYHWFMATKRGAEAIAKDRNGFAHLHWQNWAPDGWFDEATFERVSHP